MPERDQPKRVISSESGKIVYLVEWECITCSSKGCKDCKFSGVLTDSGRRFKQIVKRTDLKPRNILIGDQHESSIIRSRG